MLYENEQMEIEPEKYAISVIRKLEVNCTFVTKGFENENYFYSFIP